MNFQSIINNNIGGVQTQCNCCESSIKVMTIYDMLHRAYEIINHDKTILKVIDFLNLKIEDVVIAQNRMRKSKMVDDEFESNRGRYSIVYGGKESPIMLCFNEDFSYIEAIQISTKFLNYINFESYKSNNLAQLAYLKDFFCIIDDGLSNIEEYLSIENGLILKNKNFSKGGYYPSVNNDGVHVEIWNNEKSFIRISMSHYDYEFYESSKNLSKWLHQTIISMFPDFGNAHFWFPPDGTGTDITKFEDIVSKDLIEEFEEWQNIFEHQAPFLEKDFGNDKFDWKTFNKQGKNLCQKLQQIIKHKYIIVYSMSYEESQDTKTDRNCVLASIK